MASLLYNGIKPLIRWGLHAFYSSIEYDDFVRHLPKEGPVIIISNHQNALIDPILACVESPREIHYLARASAFKNPVASAILKELNMLPVFRLKDSVDIQKANAPIFEEILKRLCKNEVIGIFPEGNHGGRRKLRAQKKGYARMCWMALHEGCDPFIYPVGIDYSSQFQPNSRVILKPGKGFFASSVEWQGVDEKDFLNNLVTKGKEALLPVMLEIRNPSVDKLIYRLDQIGWRHNELKNLEARKTLVDQLEALPEDEIELLREQVKKYQAELQNAGRKHHNIDQRPVNPIHRGIYFLGQAISYPLKKWFDSIEDKLIEDPQFTSTIRFMLYLLGLPIWALLFMTIFWIVLGWASGLSVLFLFIFSYHVYWRGKKNDLVVTGISEAETERLTTLKVDFENHIAQKTTI